MATRWARITVRSREGKLIRKVRKDLVQHVGGEPNVGQKLLIERIVMLVTLIARMDAKALELGTMAEHSSRQYLAWVASLRRSVSALGLDGAPAKVTPFNETYEEISRRGRPT